MYVLSFPSSDSREKKLNIYTYTVDLSALKLARAMRQSFCLMCGYFNFTKTRFPSDSIFCKYCSQKMCMHHLRDLKPHKWTSNKDYASLSDLHSRLTLCCKACKSVNKTNDQV